MIRILTKLMRGSHGVEQKNLDDVLAQADFVSLHLPLSSATKHIIDKKAIASMKECISDQHGKGTHR